MKNLAPIDETKDIVDKEYVDTVSSKLSTNGMGVVVHGANASTARPVGFAQVTWIGTVEPTNAVTNDIWYNDV